MNVAYYTGCNMFWNFLEFIKITTPKSHDLKDQVLDESFEENPSTIFGLLYYITCQCYKVSW